MKAYNVLITETIIRTREISVLADSADAAEKKVHVNYDNDYYVFDDLWGKSSASSLTLEVNELPDTNKKYACESCSLVKSDVKWHEETEQYECEECWQYFLEHN